MAGAISLTASSAGAQTSTAPPVISPDRPDFTDSSQVVGHGVLQIETGVRREHSDRDSREISAPNLLARFGIGPRFEMRFAADGYISQVVRTPVGEVHTNGHSDITVGAKLKVVDGAAAGFDISLQPFVSFPTASNGLGSDGHDPGVKLGWERDLPHDVGISGNVNVTSSSDSGGRTWTRELSVSVDKAIGPAWGGFGEIYGALHDGQCDCAIDTGLLHTIGANSQIDIEAGRRVSGDAPRWFVGAGFAVRRLHH